MGRGLILFLILLPPSMASSQTCAPAKNAHAPRVTARDSVSVSAGLSKDALKKEAEYDKVFQSAMDLKFDGEYEDALATFQDAERIAAGLPGIADADSGGSPKQQREPVSATTGNMKDGALQGVLEQEADTLAMLKRFDESEKVSLRRVDVLRAWTGEYDGAFAHNYFELAGIRMLQQDWKKAEEYCLQGMKAYDKVIAHFSGQTETIGITAAERRAKALDMYYLGLIYYRESKYVESLETLDRSFSAASELHARRESLSQIAPSARNIALESFHLMEASKWEGRLHSLPENEPSKH